MASPRLSWGDDPAATSSAGEIRRADASDHEWIARTAARVYHDLGEYGAVMPQWLVQPGVIGWIEEANTRERRGFAVLGFYQDPGPGSRSHQSMPASARTVADLLAIGVDPRWQRFGIGTRMLEHVIAVVRAVAPSHGIGDLRLTVSDTNEVGQRWYVRHGFRVVDGHHGSYANGQRALRMARALP